MGGMVSLEQPLQAARGVYRALGVLALLAAAVYLALYHLLLAPRCAAPAVSPPHHLLQGMSVVLCVMSTATQSVFISLLVKMQCYYIMYLWKYKPTDISYCLSVSRYLIRFARYCQKAFFRSRFCFQIYLYCIVINTYNITTYQLFTETVVQ